jgi:hypothetical protein
MSSTIFVTNSNDDRKRGTGVLPTVPLKITEHSAFRNSNSSAISEEITSPMLGCWLLEGHAFAANDLAITV